MTGNIESNRLAIYIFGVDNEKLKKLLGAPETKDCTGLAKAEVMKVLEEWGWRRKSVVWCLTPPVQTPELK